MVSVARKNLLAEKTRLFTSVSGVAFSILLIIFLMGVYNAFSELSTAYIDNIDADIIVGQEGVTDMFHTFSVLGTKKISQVERVSGGDAYGLVSRAGGVLVTEEDGSKIVDYPGRPKGENVIGDKEIVNIVGFDTKTTGMGGPWVMISGSDSPGKREIVVDKVFAGQTGLSIGDQIEAYDEVFTIVGITDKNNMMVYTRAFVDLGEAQDILKEKDTVNFILVKLPDPSQASEVVERLEREISGISAFTNSDFAISNGKMINES
ncbi:MAG: ABC transporter permease, partial [Patescibacteria group bacterium]